MKKSIPSKEVTLTNRFDLDPVGYVFFWKGKTYRAIRPEFESHIRELLKSGLINELSSKKLFPASKVTVFTFKECNLVVEHQSIVTITYPHEWSFEMFKDAAKCVLRVNEISRRYGYQTKDCHPYNILFNYFTPQFIDLGSFIKLENKSVGWVAIEEFRKCYYYPLSLWSKGFDFISYRIRMSASEMLSHHEYYQFNNPWLGFFPYSRLKSFFSLFFTYFRLTSIPRESFKTVDKKLILVYEFLKKNHLLWRKALNYNAWIKTISHLSKRSRTFWADYHDDLVAQIKSNNLSPRFTTLLSLVKSYPIRTAVDIGGNQGAFSKLLLSEAKLEQVVCVDADENAIDSLYLTSKDSGAKLVPVIQNPISLAHNLTDKLLYERFQGDAVFMLALTHHLILTQGYSPDLIFRSIKKYSKKYVFIEFMPLGLYYGPNSPQIPSWYTSKWFEIEFRKHFKIIDTAELDENRLLFFGEIK